MSSLPPNPRARPVHYYEGMMMMMKKKRGPGETGYKKYWTGLLGNSLYFYNHHRDVQYVEVVSLDDFVSLVDDNSWRMVTTEAKMTLNLKDRIVNLKVDSTEQREMWKGFILTVTQLNLPTGLSLLPGPLQMMQEVLEKERTRRSEMVLDCPDSGEYVKAIDEELLPCYYDVTRQEAQDMLTSHPEYGNLILRPSQDGTGISVTTCQKNNGRNVLRHYRVLQHNGAYVIEVEPAVHCSSLPDIMNYFVKRTGGALVPFSKQPVYEDRLDFVSTDEENGETIIANGGSLGNDSTNTQFGSRQPQRISTYPEQGDGENDDADEPEYINEPTSSSSRRDISNLQVAATPPMPFPRATTPSSSVSTTEDRSTKRASLGFGGASTMPSRMPPGVPRVLRSKERAGIEEKLERTLRLCGNPR